MTAKRFEMGYDDGLLRFVKDNVTNTNLDIVDCWTVLNELNDENEQLKQLNIPVDEIEETVIDSQERVIAIYYKKENPIVKENVSRLTQIFEDIENMEMMLK